MSSAATGISARVGLFLPTSGAARDEGSTWLAFGVDYRISNATAPAMVMKSGTGTFFSISADYYDRGDFRNIPIAVNYNVRAQNLIFTAGIGADIETVFDNETVDFGGQLAITYEFGGRSMGNVSANNTYFLQAKYFLCSHSELDGLGVYLGMKF